MRLFDSDSKRVPYTAENKDFVVSPANAREQLTTFIRGAKKQLLMYEMKISDNDFVKLLNEKISQGVDVRVIGSTSNKGRHAAGAQAADATSCAGDHSRWASRCFSEARVCASWSSRRGERLGIIVHDPKIAKQMIGVFDKDWSGATPAAAPAESRQSD